MGWFSGKNKRHLTLSLRK